MYNQDTIRERSFFSDYCSFFSENIKDFKIFIPIYLLVTGIVYGLTHIVYYSFVAQLLDILAGYSLLSLGFFCILIALLDIKIKEGKNFKIKYTFTILWTLVLSCAGVVALFFSQKYIKHYRYECSTFLVDTKTRCYHIPDGCDDTDLNDLQRMKGYEIISNDYTFCESCEEFLDDAEDEYEFNRYRHP